MLLRSTSTSTLRLMFVVGRLHDESSGVTRILCDLANSLSHRDAQVDVYATDCPGMPTAPHLLDPQVRYITQHGQWLGGLSRSPILSETIDRDVRDCDVVHCHSLWMLPNHYASEAAHRYDKPIVFTAHGALEPWALSRSRWKKLPVAWWWQDRDLGRASCIHVNSERELQAVRVYGLKNPIAIVPNGIDLEPFDLLPSRTELANRFPQLAGKKVILFLSRLHEKKGLSHLIEAWHRMKSDHRDWHLLIAGPDDGAKSATEQCIAELKLEQSTTLCGPLMSQDKLIALAGADAFILPSFSEGFSMAILEAMAAKLPVMLTPGCNFPQAARAGAALEIEPNAESTERGLRDMLAMTDAERREMGSRGRALIEQHHTWDAISLDMMALYGWLDGGGAAPGFVQQIN